MVVNMNINKIISTAIIPLTMATMFLFSSLCHAEDNDIQNGIINLMGVYNSAKIKDLF